MSITLLNNPNTEYLKTLPTLDQSPIDWLNISTESLIRLKAVNYDLKIFLGENFPLWRERWLEARRLKKRLSHQPFHSQKNKESKDMDYLLSLIHI